MEAPKRAAVVVVLRGDVEVACWTLDAVGRPDLCLVEELARLQLTARRMGCSIRVRDEAAELRSLLDLVGLSGVLGAADPGDEPPAA